jgi:plastocyanin
METPGGSLYIPDRAVDLVHRRAISRNTHYMLTEEEAAEIRNDERVIACERLAKDRGIVPDYLWTQTGDFNKTTGTFAGDDRNWGLWRVITGDTSYPAAATYNINVSNSGSSAYTLSGSDRNGSVSGNNVTVTLTVGDTVNFVVNASGHPFYIRVSNGGANVSTPAATNQGTQSGTVSWTPNTAGTYYYQCGFHSGMIGTITVNAQTSDWGSDSTAEITNKTIRTTASGKNVDVVIVDAHINPDHPEFAVNSDGSGGSRVNQFNWFQYNNVLGYGSNGTYTYSTSGASPNSNHGTHVAGTCCGNTQGWARDSNIYNVAFDDTLSGVTDWDERLWDYLRYFHKNKAINPVTGRRNPTVTNHSWGYSYGSIILSVVSLVEYRGTTTSVSGTDAQKKVTLEDNGVPVPANTYLFKTPARVAAVDADIQDAINDGVIVISSAGNSYWNCDVPGGDDYNNSINAGGTIFHSRGSTPGSADNVICVGSMGSKTDEYKSVFSNWGKRVDIWASGSDIISAVYDSASATTENSGSYTPIIADSRNSSYYLASISGTSMASPQVCGVIACLAEQEPNLTQAEALQYLKENSKANCGDDGGDINHSPYETFGSTSNNRYLFIVRKRQESGSLQPTLFKNRNPDTAGVKYPRRNTRVALRS